MIKAKISKSFFTGCPISDPRGCKNNNALERGLTSKLKKYSKIELFFQNKLIKVLIQGQNRMRVNVTRARIPALQHHDVPVKGLLQQRN